MYREASEAPRVYASIETLWEDLKKAVPDAYFENGRICLPYAGDVMSVGSCGGEFYTYMNGVLEEGTLDADIVYDVCAEFMHEKRTDIPDITLMESEVTAFTEAYLTYFDTLGRDHRIELSVCADRYAETHPNDAVDADGLRYVGEWGIERSARPPYLLPALLFSAPSLPVRLVLSGGHVWGRKRSPLVGSLKKRVRNITELLGSGGFAVKGKK